MSFGILCRTKDDGGCGALATFRFTWPGKDESYVCPECALKLCAIANAIGLHLQMIALSASDHAGPLGMQSIEEQLGAREPTS